MLINHTASPYSVVVPAAQPSWLLSAHYLNRHRYAQQPVFQPAAPAVLRRPPLQGSAEDLERQAAARAAAEERAAADRLALELLRSHLSEDQRRMLDASGYFIVATHRGRYRIRCGSGLVGNIDVLGERDGVRHRLCCHLRQNLPMGDHLLAQKIMLEHAEEDFLRLANVHSA